MKPPLITNMMQRKDISKYIYKYFVEKDEKEHFVKDIVKWEQKLDTELDGRYSHCIYQETFDMLEICYCHQ
jgi:hypothetical protein